MPPADKRAQAASSRLSEVSKLRGDEWDELLRILRLADSPVGEAIHWFESRGYGARFRVHGEDEMAGKRRKVCELWRFVSDLLASEVVYVEEEEETKRTRTMGSCIWMQTLPNAVQTNVLTFLNAEHRHFRSKDLEALARRVLQCPVDADFWVFQAARTLLHTISQDAEFKLPGPSEDEQLFGLQDSEIADYDKLPEWLEKCREGSDAMFAWLPLGQPGYFQEEVQTNDKHHSPGSSGLSQPDLEVAEVEVEDFKQPMRQPSECEKSPRAPSRQTEEPTAGEKYTLTITKTNKEELGPSGNGDELHQGDEVVSGEDDKAARAVLGDNLYLKALSLGQSLRASPGPGLAEEIRVVRSTPKFASFLSVARAWEVDDEVTLFLVGSLLVEQDGYAWSTQVLQTIILPKLFALERPASRIFTTAVVQAGKIHPRAVVDSVMFPLICSNDGASSIQCELLNRMVKDCLPEDLILSLVQKMFTSSADKNQNLTSGLAWKWTEGMVGVVQNLLSYKVNLDHQSVACLVQALDVAVAEFSKSLKLGNLLLNLVTKHGSRVKSHKGLLQHVVDKSQTFLTKSLQTKLAAL